VLILSNSELQKRFSHRYQFTASYALQKNLTQSAAVNLDNYGAGYGPTNQVSTPSCGQRRSERSTAESWVSVTVSFGHVVVRAAQAQVSTLQ